MGRHREKGVDMRRKLTWLVLLSAAIVITALYHARNVSATTAGGFTGTTLAQGRFGEIDVFNHLISPDALHEGQEGQESQDRQEGQEGQEGHKRNIWMSRQKTKGMSDLYVQSNVWLPGGSTGWHSHPGHSLIVVTAGTVTAYEGNDPECKASVYTKGMGFVDAGGDHVHILRNEGPVEARTITVQLIPADAMRRIDVQSPGNCPF
jgi:hypothetical protein